RVGPSFGTTLVMTGTPTKVKGDGALALPPPSVTVTVVAPAACGGVTTVSSVPSGATVVTPPGARLKVTFESGPKLVPVKVTRVPPVVGPLMGLMVATVGVASNVNWSATTGKLVPPGEVTITL